MGEEIHGFLRLLREHLDERDDDGMLPFGRVRRAVVVLEPAELELMEFDDRLDDELGLEGGEMTFGEDRLGNEEEVGEEEEKAVFDGLETREKED